MAENPSSAPPSPKAPDGHSKATDGQAEKKSAVAMREEETLELWKERDIFKKTLEKVAPKGEYVFYDGPPFATGLPHHGSLLSSIIKDVVPRFWTMRGFRVRRRWGWDCHGLPIESLVEKELGLKTKKDILDVGIQTFNEKARSMVLQFVHDWEKYVERIGRWVDFKNSYKTMDNTYIESVWWALKELWNRDLLYEGNKVLMYCTHCETPLAKAEIAMDNTYKDITEEAMTVKFKIKGQENVYLLAWTTTPWTLPGNVALAVGKEIEYVRVQKIKYEPPLKAQEMKPGVELQVSVTRPEFYIVAKSLFEKAFSEKSGFVTKEYKGVDLVGLEYEPLFDVPALKSDKSYKVYAADFVSTEEGTGIVHTAVMYGEDDYALGQKIGLPMVQMLNPNGTYNDKAPVSLQGKYIKAAEKEIKHDLESRGLLFEKKNHTHSYPHCYRCGTPLIYNAVGSWFINIQKVKARLLEENEKVRWIPGHLKHGRFHNIVENAPDWTISRNRFWASPLPIWKCEKCGKLDVIGSLAELKEKAREEVPADLDLHRPYVDAFTFACACGGSMKRVPEVVDCWVESGSMPFAELHYPFENKELFAQRSPADFIAEYIAQTRTWFYYMHALGVLLFDRLAFKNVISTGTILAADGEKISKSKRNYTDPLALIDRFGADALRFYLMASPVMLGEDINFRDEDVKEAHNKIVGRLANVLSFYALHTDETPRDFRSKNVLDTWILARLAALVGETTSGYESYEIDRATRPLALFIEDLSVWYLRRSRERLKSGGEDKRLALETLRYVLHSLSRVMAPVTPFLAEHMFQAVREEEDEESVHLASWPEMQAPENSEGILTNMLVARTIVSQALKEREKHGLNVRQPLAKLTIPEAAALSPDLLSVIAEEVNVKKVEASGTTLSLDMTLTPELKEEGIVRETMRTVQDARKAAGLRPGEQGAVSITVSPEDRSVVETHLDLVEKQTNTKVTLQ